MRTAPDTSSTGSGGDTRPRRHRSIRAVVATIAGVVAFGGLAGVPGGEAPASAQGCGPVLTVSKSKGLDPAGETVTVSGSCFDVNKGIYVAFCVVPPPGSPPSPCGGGVAMEGSGGLSHWISSNPPPYAEGLTVPYGPGGSFTVTLRPSAVLNAEIDCRVVQCAIATRNDHTRSSDRSQDGIVPVTFAAAAPAPTEPAPSAPPETLPPTTLPPETVPETTTTEAPEATTTTVEVTTTEAPLDQEAELASAEAETSSGLGAGAWVAIVVVPVLLAGGATALVLRNRTASRGTS